MQVSSVNAVLPGVASQAAAEATRGANSAIQRSDLQSTLAPIQALEATRASLNSTSVPPVVYARPLPLASVAGTTSARSGASETKATSGTDRETSAGSAFLGDSASSPKADLVSDVLGSIPGRQNDPGDSSQDDEAAAKSDASSAGTAERPSDNPGGLTEEELQQVENLAERDREVRQHEQGHVAVGGPYAGAPAFEYKRGPDGKSYAVSGEVPIDVAPVAGNPEATLRKMQTVKAAALAPAEPSPQDRSVAALATQQILQAQAELSAQAAREATAESDSDSSVSQDDGGQQARRASDQSEDDEKNDVALNRLGEAIETYQELIELGQRLNQPDGSTTGFSAIA